MSPSALTQDAGRAPLLHTISRRGLVPLPQTTFRPSAVRGDGEALLACADSIRRVLAMARELAREVENRGGDWREVVTFIRHLAPALWRRLPPAEQRRFVRHLQAYWDVHRHRMPPQLGDRIASLRRSGRLRVNAGRIDSVTAAGERLRCRGGRAAAAPRHADGGLDRQRDGPGLLAQALRRIRCSNSLRAAGWVSEDALNLGLRTARHGACVDAQGRRANTSTISGPMLRAGHWEATAATELRNHAERLAAHLAGR